MKKEEVEILIAEDSRTQAELLKGILQEEGYAVFWACNGKQAMDRIRTKAPTLLLSDILMPEMNGYELCARIREDPELKDLPVVLLTELSDPIDIMKGLECGADNFIIKPYEKEYLLARIKYILANLDLRSHQRARMGIEVLFAGKRYVINSERQQILDLLLSIYEAALQKNQELKKAEEELRSLNGRLEEIIAARTAALVNEMMEKTDAEKKLRKTYLKLEETLRQLERTQQQVIQQERLRAMGTMAAGIAHDFNNSLSAILGFSDLLLTYPENLENKEKVLRYLKAIHVSAQDAGDVVKRLREFYKKREEDDFSKTACLKLLLEEAISLTQPRWKDQALEKGIMIQIKMDLPDDLPESVSKVSVDLREVFINLILNGVDAMPNGGTIAISARESQGSLRLEVSDTGTGMSQETMQRCLEPFYTTKGEQGTGLGLSIVYGIIDRQGGKIQIESEVGKGATFVITLPPLVKNSGAHEGSFDPPVSLLLRVLVVDDEDLVREMLQAYLQEDGHQVETARNGKEALEKFKPGAVDLVITDRAMPELNGEKLASMIKKVSPSTPVIMLTGFGELMDAVGEKIPGVDLVLSKPITLDGVRKGISKVFHHF